MLWCGRAVWDRSASRRRTSRRVEFVDDHVTVDECPAWIVVGLAEIVAVGTGRTVTVTDACACPPDPVTKSVYVVVAVGDTDVLPDVATAAPLSVPLVAFVDDHVTVADCPAWIVVGLAEIVAVGAGGAVTVTVADACTWPPDPVTTSVNVVVAVRDTVALPDVATAVPLILALVAFVDDHVTVVDCPAWIVVGLAKIVAVGAGAGGSGVIVATKASWTLGPTPTGVI